MDITISIEEVRALIQGKFEFRNCLECSGKGWVWADYQIGEIIDAPTTDDSARYGKEQCENCRGLGGFLKFL